MDFQDVQMVMSGKGFATNPAFDNVNILIEPIPCLNGCPLGLYYPDKAIIVLPPDATRAALLHELGHRHGHFYYDDLSERYAENFRHRYEKGNALLYVGNDFSRLSRFGAVFEEGEKGAVEVAMFNPITREDLEELGIELYRHCGSFEKRPEVRYGYNDSPWVRVEFTKGVDWLVIIGSILTATALAGVGAIGYAVYKTSKDTPWMVPLALAATGSFLLLRHAYKKGYVRIE